VEPVAAYLTDVLWKGVDWSTDFSGYVDGVFGIREAFLQGIIFIKSRVKGPATVEFKGFCHLLNIFLKGL
jgi:hypothetical protein